MNSNIHIIVDIITISNQVPASNGEHLSGQLKRRDGEDASQREAFTVPVIQVVNLRQRSVPLQHDRPVFFVGNVLNCKLAKPVDCVVLGKPCKAGGSRHHLGQQRHPHNI